mmetsp:Transcript_35746/g.83120  ORF Transcript_35746/g.83120 Transcript_35746/m.83120 type:complete len:396 (-) Transcript_35746:66-1253(-)
MPWASRQPGPRVLAAVAAGAAVGGRLAFTSSFAAAGPAQRAIAQVTAQPALSVSCAEPGTSVRSRVDFAAGAAGERICGAASVVVAGLTALGVAAQRQLRGRMAMSATGGSSGVIETFLVQGPVDASKLATSCAPLAAHLNLECLAFFSLGVAPDLIASVAGGSLGIHGVCPVYIADCYGIIGWDRASGANVELMEKGRGQEYGGVGGKGGEGVVVVAFRGGGHTPSSSTAEGDSLPANCGMHLVVRASGTPATPLAGVVYGGVAKACYMLEHSGDLVAVPQFAVSTPTGVVSSFVGDAGEAATTALQALPNPGAAPSTAGYFPCFMRGVNQYGEDGVEPAAFVASGLQAKLFGMFAHGELGPPKGKPVACPVGAPPEGAVEMHSMTSVLALYSS